MDEQPRIYYRVNAAFDTLPCYWFLNSACGRCDMHTVMWTFKVPAGTSKAQLIETINATAAPMKESQA